MDAMDNHRYLNDLWTLEGGLGLGAAGDQVARIVLEAQPPFTLGVIGKWGAGKTSVLRRAFVTLGGEPIQQPRPMAQPEREGQEEWQRFRGWEAGRKGELQWPEEYYLRLDGLLCVWFSPWQHQNESNPLVPLVKEIRTQFEARLTAPARHGRRLKRGWQAINRRGGLAAAKLLEHTVDAAATLVTGRPASLARGVSEGMRQAWREAEPDLLAPSDGQRFHLLFEDAVNEALTALRAPLIRRGQAEEAEQHARLVVFIDDLDRCEQEVIVRLLEAIKLYLSSRRCLFVFGLDDGAVLEALRNHWTGRSEDSNREYLEKLFQATLAVPLPNGPQVTAVVAQQLRQHGIVAAEAMAQDIEQLLEPNPRKVKNFTNGLCAAWGLHRAGEWIGSDRAEARRFVLFHYLRQFHRPVWRLIERQPAALHLLWAVLSGSSQGDIDADRFPDCLAEQRLLQEILFRAFSHVLRPTDPEERSQHGNESLEQAVKAFEERRDRRRSDEQFRLLFRQLIGRDTTLDPRYLHLPPAATLGA